MKKKKKPSQPRKGDEEGGNPFDRYSDEELVQALNREYEREETIRRRSVFICGLGNELLNRGIDCSCIIRGSLLHLGDPVKLLGNKLVLWPYKPSDTLGSGPN